MQGKRLKDRGYGQLNSWLPKKLIRRLRNAAAAKRLSMTIVLQTILERELDAMERANGGPFPQVERAPRRRREES